MNFVDQVKIAVEAGDGGDGSISFRHEKFIAKGGPDGGDGGDGGDIIFEASANQDTLANFRYKKIIKAENGDRGSFNNRHGKRGKDQVVLVPIGTLIYDQDQLLVDLVQNHQREIIAKGGQGGFGNAHFISSTRQAPKFAEKGLKGQKIELQLELKMIADVGLIGLPNVGKSSLISRISQARPKIADYSFTTLKPSLGMLDFRGQAILIADIPGLIAGASSGKGLGFDFLRHIERTKILVHVVDISSSDPINDYLTIRHELETYQIDLKVKPEIIVFNKVDLLSQTEADRIINSFKKKLKTKTSILKISTQSLFGLDDLKDLIYREVDKINQLQPKDEISPETVKIINFDHLNPQTSRKFTVSKIANNKFKVTGQDLENLVNKTDFNNSEAVNRLHNLLIKRGLVNELKKQGAKDDCLVYLADHKIDFLF